ncbi:MAG TPA: hypothetical protein VF646_17450, partial [Cytophagales bacterium]
MLAALCTGCALGGLTLPAAAQSLPPDPYRTEQGLPPIQNYSPKAWERLTPFVDTWCLAQDRAGRMTIGSSGGVLLYNGATWELVETPERTNVRALAQDATGRVYVGGENDLGYLAPGATGKMQFVSLLDQLPASQRTFGLVLTVIPTPAGVYFGTDDYLFRWHQGRFRAWKAQTTFGLAFWVNQQLYVAQPDYGLTVLRQDKLEVVSQDTVLVKGRVRVILPAANGEIFIGTRQHGLFTLKDKQLKGIRGNSHALLTERNSVYRGIALPDGTIALATLQRGVVLVDRHGRLKGMV